MPLAHCSSNYGMARTYCGKLAANINKLMRDKIMWLEMRSGNIIVNIGAGRMELDTPEARRVRNPGKQPANAAAIMAKPAKIARIN